MPGIRSSAGRSKGKKRGRHRSDTDTEQHDTYQCDDLDKFGDILEEEERKKNADSERRSGGRSERTQTTIRQSVPVMEGDAGQELVRHGNTGESIEKETSEKHLSEFLFVDGARVHLQGVTSGDPSIDLTAINTQHGSRTTHASPAGSMLNYCTTSPAIGCSTTGTAEANSTRRSTNRTPIDATNVSASPDRDYSSTSVSTRRTDSDRAPAKRKYVQNNWNALVSKFPWIDTSVRQRCLATGEVFCLYCGNYFRFAGERDFKRHELTRLHEKNTPRSSSQSLTTLKDFIKNDRDATCRARQLAANSIAGLGLSLRTIEQITSPDMVSCIDIRHVMQDRMLVTGLVTLLATSRVHSLKRATMD